MSPRPISFNCGLPPDADLMVALWQSNLESPEDDSPSFLTLLPRSASGSDKVTKLADHRAALPAAEGKPGGESR